MTVTTTKLFFKTAYLFSASGNSHKECTLYTYVPNKAKYSRMSGPITGSESSGPQGFVPLLNLVFNLPSPVSLCTTPSLTCSLLSSRLLSTIS